MGFGYTADSVGTDTYFFASGSVGSKDGATPGVAVFGGDVVASGTVFAPQGLSGSLTKLTDGTDYLQGGTNISVTTGSDGSVTVSLVGDPEVVDPDTGDPLPYGEDGVLVFTTLTKEGIPLLRYKTNDICNIFYDPDGKRTHIKMSAIKGRTDDMLIIRGVNLFPTQVEDVLKENTSTVLPGEKPAGGGGEETDALYDEAVMIVTETRKASISYVQRRLKIGYNRAARMIEDMEAAGVVSAMQSNGSREVLAPPPPDA